MRVDERGVRWDECVKSRVKYEVTSSAPIPGTVASQSAYFASILALFPLHTHVPGQSTRIIYIALRRCIISRRRRV
jgi:hypothetical protein